MNCKKGSELSYSDTLSIYTNLHQNYYLSDSDRCYEPVQLNVLKKNYHTKAKDLMREDYHYLEQNAEWYKRKPNL